MDFLFAHPLVIAVPGFIYLILWHFHCMEPVWVIYPMHSSEKIIMQFLKGKMKLQGMYELELLVRHVKPLSSEQA